MSQTLLLRPPSQAGDIPRFQPYHDHDRVGTREHTNQHLQQLRAAAEVQKSKLPDLLAPAPEENMLASILAPFASHHHQSDYNRLKFGSQGSAIPYIPLSLSLPSHIRQLRDRQAIHAAQPAFFEAATSEIAEAALPVLSVPSLFQQVPRSLEDENPASPLSAPSLSPIRSSSPTLSSQPLQSASLPSESHSRSPKLDASLHTTEEAPTHSLLLPSVNPPPSDSLRHEIDLAIKSSLTDPPAITVIELRPATPEPAVPLPPKNSETHPINIAAILPPEVLPFIWSKITPTESHQPTFFSVPVDCTLPRIFASLYQPPPPPPPPAPSPPRALNMQGPPAFLRHQSAPSAMSHTSYANRTLPQSPVQPTSPPTIDLRPATQQWYTNIGPIMLQQQPPSRLAQYATPSFQNTSEATTQGNSAPLGNLLLSSCPGKKVRLGDGQARSGRAAICRDLDLDLARIKNLGVGCIICCLDDEEMAFLGAPWVEYQASAVRLGLDVLRLPTPEGLAPLDAGVINQRLENIIEGYTLKGVNVLVHCRGGVGRAGLIACCWMIKLGLCGWVAPAPPPPKGCVRKDALALVDSAIRIVRRRRSLKAIETYEQVRFLLDFVEHLRASTTSFSSSSGPGIGSASQA